MNTTIQFFIGKGGVGKSTTSALSALFNAHTGQNTLLVSMDPAHNQSDLFEEKFSNNAKQIMHHLWVKEIDIDHWTNVYLMETVSQLKKTYSYHSAFNIEGYFDILKHSPGLEEYSMLLAFEDILKSNEDKDHIIFDMPPTALTLRFISLPFVSLIWLDQLLTLRNQIYEKKEIVSKIKFGKKEIEQDKVKVRLQKLFKDYTRLRNIFSDVTTRINLVLNNDKLSFSEAIRIKMKLKDIGVGIRNIIVNKIKNSEVFEEIDKEFCDHPMIHLPYINKELSGLEPLKRYLLHNIKEMSIFS